MNRLAWYRVATNLKFVKNEHNEKSNKMKYNKAQYALQILTFKFRRN